MHRRAFLSGMVTIAVLPVTIAVLPVTIAVAQQKKLRLAVIWDHHEQDAISIQLGYDDGSSTTTTIPGYWLFTHPIEARLVVEGWSLPDKPYKDWVELCATMVEEYTHGR